MIKRFIDFFTGDKSTRLIKQANSIFSVFDKTLKQLKKSNDAMLKHQDILNKEIQARQSAHTNLGESIAKNGNTIANIEKMFTLT